MIYDMIYDMIYGLMWYDMMYDTIWYIMCYMIYGTIWYYMIYIYIMILSMHSQPNLEPKWRCETGQGTGFDLSYVLDYVDC